MQTVFSPNFLSRSQREFAHALWKYSLHDMFGLITTIDTVAEACQKSEDDLLQRHGSRLSRCSKRMLTICTENTDRKLDQEWQPSRSLNAILFDVANFAKDHAGTATTVSVFCDDEEWHPIYADVVFRVIYNLAVNSVKAVNSCGGGRVFLKGRVEDGILSVEVVDDGPGIGEAAKNEPLANGPRKRPGLGLHIAELLTESIGGDLEIVQSGSVGTTIRFTHDQNGHF